MKCTASEAMVSCLWNVRDAHPIGRVSSLVLSALHCVCLACLLSHDRVCAVVCMQLTITRLALCTLCAFVMWC